MMLAKYLRGFAGAIFLLNLFSIIFGIAYLVYPAYTPVWDLFGVILLITFFGDLLFVYLLDGILDKNVPSGNRINWAGYGFIIVMILAMVGILGGNFLSSAMYSNAFGIANFIVIISFFAILLIGFIIGGWAVKSQPFCTEWQPSRQLTRACYSTRMDPHHSSTPLTLCFRLDGLFRCANLSGNGIGNWG